MVVVLALEFSRDERQQVVKACRLQLWLLGSLRGPCQTRAFRLSSFEFEPAHQPREEQHRTSDHPPEEAPSHPIEVIADSRLVCSDDDHRGQCKRGDDRRTNHNGVPEADAQSCSRAPTFEGYAEKQDGYHRGECGARCKSHGPHCRTNRRRRKERS